MGSDCRKCDCPQYRWDGKDHWSESSSPTSCRCGHFASDHRYR